MTRRRGRAVAALVTVAAAGALGVAVVRDDDPVGAAAGGQSPEVARTTVTVTVVDAAGRPVDGALVRASEVSARMYVDGGRATARGGGAYALSLTRGTWRVTAEADGRQGGAEVTVADGSPAAVEVRLV